MRHLARIAAGVAALLAVAGAAAAAPQKLDIDRSHSEVGFNIRHFFTKVHGSFSDFDGTIVYDPENLTASSVEVTIRDSSIFTGNARRDGHLRSDEFFWTEKYPHITFKSTKIIPGKDPKKFQVAGDLTIRDVTKPVVLDAELHGIGAFASGGRDMGVRAGFEARTTIDRKDYGIVWNRALDQGGAMLADDVEIVLSIEAVGKTEAAAAGAKTPAKK